MKATILYITLLLFLASCNSDDCNNAVCTDDFRLVAVSVVDQNNMNVELDSTRSTVDNGTILVIENIEPGFEDSYIVVDDSHMDDLPGSNNIVTFNGWKNGIEVVDQEFVITRDCCHIGKGEGPDQIVIE